MNAPLAYDPALKAFTEPVFATMNAPFAYDEADVILVFCWASTPYEYAFEVLANPNAPLAYDPADRAFTEPVLATRNAPLAYEDADTKLVFWVAPTPIQYVF